MTDRTLEILPDAEAVARRAAEELAAEAHRAIRAIGRFTFAVSGGRSPWEMFRELAAEDVACDRVGMPATRRSRQDAWPPPASS